MTRDEQITTLARRMNTDWLASFHDPASDMDVITLCATIAIELAEATRAYLAAVERWRANGRAGDPPAPPAHLARAAA